MALVEAIAHLLQNNKVYVSIYENSSKDKTRALLSDLGAALQAGGVTQVSEISSEGEAAPKYEDSRQSDMDSQAGDDKQTGEKPNEDGMTHEIDTQTSNDKQTG